MEGRSSAEGAGGRASLEWLDLLKGLALIWIFLNHLSERFLGFPHIGNPSPDWPPLEERVSQLLPLTGHGVADLPLNLFRYVGWAGDNGVALFLILSGFALTWGLLERHGSSSLPLREFYTRRLGRIYPLWWAAHLLFVLPWLLGSSGLAFSGRTLLSLAGIRCLPSLLYYFAPAWWYVGLLLQLYAVYPALWKLFHRWGPRRFLLIACAVGFVARALGLIQPGPYTDAWQRGALFVTRLPEFAFGMALAAWMKQDPEATDRRLRSPRTLLSALLAFVAGAGLSLTLAGMALAPALQGAAVFVLLYALCGGRTWAPGRFGKGLTWTGRHSYSLYLVHHPILFALIPQGGAAPEVLRSATAAGLTVLFALWLERSTSWVSALLASGARRIGVVRVVLASGAALALIWGGLVAAELAVRRAAPQEADGWGERPSLAPHPSWGWHLKPSQSTRLRWETYDYRVDANRLGFPGPEYPVEKAPGTLRILATGDAFTSAEGVDTEQSWARLLEKKLAARLPGRKVEVLNFAITGYGPNQYAAVVREFAPLYKPDLILAEHFVNDFQDVMYPDEQFRTGVGFQLPPQGNWRFLVKLSQLRKWLRVTVAAPAEAYLYDDPRLLPGYAFGYVSAFEKDQPDFAEARLRVAARLAEIKRVADGVGARLVVPMVPASVQVCRPEQLPYFPRGVNLKDGSRYDLELPQRTLQALAAAQSAGWIDLREALAGAGGCVYQPHNMHWLPQGHEAVAEFLAARLLRDGYVGGP